MNDSPTILMPHGLPAAWEAVTAALVSTVTPPPVPDETICDALALLCEHGLGQYVEGWLLETLQVRLSTEVAPEFWNGLRSPEGVSQERDRARALLEAFRTLLLRLEPFLGGLERLGLWQDMGWGGLVGLGARGLQERAFSVIRAILLFSLQPVLQQRVLEFYSRTFSVHMSRTNEVQEGTEASESEGSCTCPGCGDTPELCWCDEALQQLQELSHIL